MSRPADWTRLSPLLDELLDLDEAARHARLAALQAEDAALAAQLAELLQRDAALSQAGFLGAPAVPGLAALQAMSGAGVAAPAAGEAVGPYTLERLLGEGGMGSVWLARRSDGRYEGQVAIKFLRAELLGLGGSTAPGQAERFAREGAILARLAHPHIARLLDAGVARDGALPYLVLEHVAGVPIDRWCHAHQLAPRARVQLLLGVIDAVAHAHNRLILHRDLKPSNILVTPEGRALLLDFGIAKLLEGGSDATELTQRAGSAYTPHCAAPEQLQGGEVTTATDVYALGVLLYGLLGGGHPTTPREAAPLERLRTVLEVQPPRLSDAVRAQGGPDAPRRARALRGDLDTIVARALKKAPAERYANAAALADDLRRWLAHAPITARPDSRLYLAGRFVRRHRLAVAAGSAATLVLAAAVGNALLEGREARRQRDQAEGLIEFMLGDLRRKLQPVGRLDVLDAVGARVLAHYAADPAQRLDADALGRRARALHLIGELAEKRGQLDDAAQGFAEAARATGLLLARSPRDGQRIFDHSQSVYWLGYIARRRGLLADTEAQFQRYRELAEQLVAINPAQREWQLERGYAQANLGIVQLETGRPREALGALQQALAVHQADATRHPDSEGEVANVLGWIAQAHQLLGEHDAARRALGGKVAALQRLPGSARQAPVQQQLALASRELGVLALLDGASGFDQAATALARALQGSQALVALDSANLDWLAQLLLVRLDLAELAQARGDAATGRAELALARPALERLLQAGSGKLYWQVDLQGSYLRQALPLGLASPDALSGYLARLAEREAGGVRLDALQQRVAAELALRLGDHLAARGQHGQATAHWQAAAGRLASAEPRRDFRGICVRAMALHALGQLQPAQALADSVEASAFRHPMCADLRRRLAAAH
ncbi:serine/threonine-protein kinase [Aquabacterium sp. OR-4]|uniref:serine/threonine-protein kinase n=1 Tax=Aquabacterium sp. OR-4 TaxID=2978127 RepID=UPI0028C99BA7|nr:serine/threonine-protein kinase [Aquabacterium sp. OR-4]MDT7837831.1 serine/threonine-protein kinase [Aquabacterium sp. OR-4]